MHLFVLVDRPDEAFNKPGKTNCKIREEGIQITEKTIATERLVRSAAGILTTENDHTDRAYLSLSPTKHPNPNSRFLTSISTSTEIISAGSK